MKVITVYCNPFIKKAIIRRFGERPFATRNNRLGAEIMEVILSERIPAPDTIKNEGMFTQIFYAQLVAYVDAQRACGVAIKKATSNFLDSMGLEEDDLSLSTALKMYDRYRTDKAI